MNSRVDTELLTQAYGNLGTSAMQVSRPEISQELAPHMTGFHSTRSLNRAVEVIPRLPSRSAAMHPNSTSRGRAASRSGMSRTLSRLGTPGMDDRFFINPGFRTGRERYSKLRQFQLQDKDMPPAPVQQPYINGVPAASLMETLGTPPISTFHCTVPPGGGNMHAPGLVLPSVYQTSQALFGSLPNQAGTPIHLHNAAESMPERAPRYLMHNTVSATSSVYSNFRKTDVAWTGQGATVPSSEYQDCFSDHFRDGAKTPIPIKFRCRNMTRAMKDKISTEMYPKEVIEKLRQRPSLFI